MDTTLPRDPDAEAVASALEAAPVAAALVDLTTERIWFANHGAGVLLGTEPSALVGRRTSDVLDPGDSEASQAAISTLRSGALQSYVARRRFAGPTEPELCLWVRSIHVGSRLYALVVLDHTTHAAPFAVTEIFSAVEVAVGVLDGTGRIERIGAEVAEVLGVQPRAIRDRPLAELVHPDDASILEDALSAQQSGPGRLIRLRLRGRAGEWVPVRCFVAGGGWRPGHRMVFLLLEDGDVTPDDVAALRVEELERHLLRISEEVHAAGVVLRVQEPAATGCLDDLTHRQWEIVTRLLRGERVPGIAKALYLSQHTVRNHLAAVFRKYGVHSQEELIAKLRTPAPT